MYDVMQVVDDKSGGLGDRGQRASLLLKGLLALPGLLRRPLVVKFVQQENIGGQGQSGVDQHEGDILVPLGLDGHERQVIVLQF